jgi:hypothetical protein
LAATAAGALAGCGFILGDEPLSFEAQPARVGASVVEDTGYEHEGTTDQTIERTITVADQSREVVVTNRIAEYSKSVDLGPIGAVRAAVFTALTTPQVSVLGETLNPVAHLSTADLADRLQNRFEDVGSLERAGESTVTVLGTETTQTRFRTEVTVAAGERIDASLHLSEPVEHEDDLAICLGGYPQRLPAEESNVLAMMEGLDHPVE